MSHKIEIPLANCEKDIIVRVENNLTRKGYKFQKKGKMGDYKLIVEVPDAQDAFWIGCNFISISNKLFDGPLTTTGL